MKQVPAVVYRWRWVLWTPWVIGVLVVVGWAIEPTGLGTCCPTNLIAPLVIYYYTAEEHTQFDMGLDGLLGWELNAWSMGEGWYLAFAAAYFGFFIGAGVVFLMPHRRAVAQLPAKRRLSWPAAVAAGLMAGCLLTAAAASLLHALGLWWDVVQLGFLFRLLEIESLWRDNKAGGIVLMVVCCHVMASVTFLIARGSDRYWKYEWLTRWLVIASLLVTAFAVAVQAGWIAFDRSRWRDDSGSYTGLWLGSGVLLWAWGCRLILLHWLRRYERVRARGHDCFACGYDLRGTLAAGRTSCPECGARVPVEQCREHAPA